VVVEIPSFSRYWSSNPKFQGENKNLYRCLPGRKSPKWPGKLNESGVLEISLESVEQKYTYNPKDSCLGGL